MMDIQKAILTHDLSKAFLQGTVGIEKESLRVKEDGKLSLSDHPAEFGSRSYHPYIQTDFSESQLELVTPAVDSLDEAYRQLIALHDVTLRTIPEDEWLWPFSMPSVLPEEEDIPIVKVNEQEEITYREGLAEKYGKRKQMISGIHFNIALSTSFIKALHSATKSSEPIVEFSNHLYMKLARNFIRYRWLITYLYGAAPCADPTFFNGSKDEDIPTGYVRSLRNSTHGYHNTQGVQVSYESIHHYASDIDKLTKEKILSEEREFYGSARLRGTKKVREMIEKGIKYVELRSIDLDPFSPYGISKETLRFLHLFCLLMIWMEEDSPEVDYLVEGNERNERTAIEHPLSRSQYQEEGDYLLQLMDKMATALGVPEESMTIVYQAQQMMKHPEQTLAARLIEVFENEQDYLTSGIRYAKEYKQEAWEKPYLLRGYEELELSTQLLIFDALQKGVKVEILDEHDQFIRLSMGNHIEYVKNGNKTSKDTYIAPLIMQNKTVTKKILKEKGYSVPGGEEYTSIEEAKGHYWMYENSQIVVKPKSTNFGIGISVFKEDPERQSYEEAVEIAFKEDSAILVEEYAAGTEYRFFVLDGETKAVLLRIPANVVGDGKRTIRELVEEKNQDPLRGENHRAPMEKIVLGEIENLMLKEQGMNVDSVPEEGQTVYLRENSNVSTGGDSIDFTDEMDETYKQIAAEITEALGAEVSGADLIIPDYTQPSTLERPGYTVIEANFNPAMHMHAYVHKGKGRRLTKEVLMWLFQELHEYNQ